ncbi:MAG: 4-alpha-glucanotransferase [Desulfobacterales bacterium]
MTIRSSGVLLHITCLFNRFGIGDLGPEAYRFADLLAESGQCTWQVLPVNPTDPGHGNSPYHSISAFAGNTLLISPELLSAENWVSEQEVEEGLDNRESYIDFMSVIKFKELLFDKAFDCFENRREKPADFEYFCRQADWLDDYALFTALRRHYQGRSWNQWPAPLRDRDTGAISEAKENFSSAIRKEKFLQYLFFSQWHKLKKHCNRRGIRIFGDIPIYMPYESVDVWTNPEQFKLDDQLRPLGLSGVPPDYFSSTGQLWGHPVYNWNEQQRTRYPWWTRRIELNLDIFDIVRIDHFRGLVGFWEVAPGEETAQRGKWVEAPAGDFLGFLYKRFGCLPIVAEDLGTITADVNEIIRRFDLPGMRVLQFAFGDDFPCSTHLPHLHEKKCVVYTGSHDNNTVLGWYTDEIDGKTKHNLHQYLGRQVPDEEIHWEMIRMAMMSVANTVIIPLQDLAGLGPDARMNTPGKSDGSWRWRMAANEFTPETQKTLYEMTRTYGRL